MNFTTNKSEKIGGKLNFHHDKKTCTTMTLRCISPFAHQKPPVWLIPNFCRSFSVKRRVVMPIVVLPSVFANIRQTMKNVTHCMHLYDILVSMLLPYSRLHGRKINVNVTLYAYFSVRNISCRIVILVCLVKTFLFRMEWRPFVVSYTLTRKLRITNFILRNVCFKQNRLIACTKKKFYKRRTFVWKNCQRDFYKHVSFQQCCCF